MTLCGWPFLNVVSKTGGSDESDEIIILQGARGDSEYQGWAVFNDIGVSPVLLLRLPIPYHSRITLQVPCNRLRLPYCRVTMNSTALNILASNLFVGLSKEKKRWEGEEGAPIVGPKCDQSVQSCLQLALRKSNTTTACTPC